MTEPRIEEGMRPLRKTALSNPHLVKQMELRPVGYSPPFLLSGLDLKCFVDVQGS